MQVSADRQQEMRKKLLVFSERLKSRRHRLGLSQESLALKAGASPRSLVAWESGENNIPQGIKLSRLAEALGVDIQWLLGEEAKPVGRAGESQPATDASRPHLWLTTATLESTLTDLAGRLPGAAAPDRKYILANIREVVTELQTREVSSRPLSEEQQILKRVGETLDPKPRGAA